jgi:hypothetical protein
MTPATALGNLRDAIRAEVIAEIVEKLEELHQGTPDEDSTYFDGYRAAIEDATSTVEMAG